MYQMATLRQEILLIYLIADKVFDCLPVTCGFPQRSIAGPVLLSL